MPYCVLTDIQNALRADALIQLTDDNDTGQINQTVVNECIARGDAIINSYCSARYIIPFAAPAPDVIRMLSEDLAIYNLYARRGEEIPDSVGEKYKNAIAQLRDISKGLIDLGLSDAADAAIQEPDVSGSFPDATTRTFTDDNTPGIQNGGSSLGGY